MTDKEYQDLRKHLWHAGFESSEIDTAVNDIIKATGDKDWLKHVDQLVAGIEITRQIMLNIYLQ